MGLIKFKFSSGFLLLLIGLFSSLFSIYLHAQPVAEKGVLDLRNHDFESSEFIPLNGEWEFLWKQLALKDSAVSNSARFVDMPHLWNKDSKISSFGYASYKLKIILPESYPALAFSIPDLYTSYVFYVEGKELAKNGIVAKNKKNYEAQWLPVTVPLDHFDKQEITIVFEVANYLHQKGGIRIPVLFGNEKELLLKRELELGYAFLLTGSLIMGGFFFLGLYLFGRNEKPILYFSLFCFSYSYRIFGTELYPLHLIMQNIPWSITARLEYLSLYFSPILFGLFVKHLYPHESNKHVINGFNGVFLFFCLAVLFLSPFYFTQLINLFFVIIPGYIIYTTWVFVLAIINKRNGARFAAAGVIVIFLVFIHNLLEYLVLIEENLFINVTGYILFFFLQSLVLSNRAAHSLIKAKEKAEQASVAKGQFLSTMSHELRTPLNAVIGFSELLVDTNSAKERVEFAQNIKKSGESLLGIINNILDYSKIESNDSSLNLQTIHLPSFVEETIKTLSGLTSSKDLELGFEYKLNETEYVSIDATRLRQVLINLVGNAVKFTDKGSIKVIVAKNNLNDAPGNILFSVEDTGIGIPTDQIQKLFQEFSQLDSSINRKFGGTGLGLAISKKLVEQMGGTIWLTSAPDEGSIFFFTIAADIVLKTEPLPQKESLPIPDKKVAQILIVEDNQVNQKVTIKLLERLGYNNYHIAANGYEAVEQVKKNEFDLILMDIEMPVMNGLEATKTILQLRNLKKMPIIIAVTANATNEDRERCMGSGMNDFLAKPITLESLGITIKKWIA